MELNILYQSIFKGEKIGPEKVMISPTDYCNLKCKICWRLEKGEKLDEPSFHEIKRWLKECKELEVKVIDLTGGGEAFMRKDIILILKLVKKFGFYGTLTTNGTLLNEEKIKKIIKMRWDDLAFSLDGPNERINDFIRGKGVFEKVIKNIKKINNLKKEKRVKKPQLRIATVVNKKNYKEISKMIELSNSLGIKSIYFSNLVEWKTNKPFWMKGIGKKKIEKYLKDAEKKAKRYGIHTNLQSLIKYGVREHSLPKFCFAPWLMFFINASGDVMVCCTLASLYSNVIGNAKKKSLKEIWFGKKMKDFRERIKKGKLFPECKRCIPEFVDNFNRWFEEMRKCY